MSIGRSNLSDAKRALLAQRLKGRTGVVAPSIPPAPRDRPAPLSFAQQRLWFLHQIGLDAAYNMSQIFRVRGPLDAAALERSLDALAERHEILRTVFGEQDDEPVQLIRAHVKLPFRVFDLAALSEGDRDRELERLLADETEAPFDLAEGPLLRAALARVAPDEHVLSITMHHAIGDDWSQRLLMRELLALHESFRTGMPSALAPLEVQYADYSVWQREQLQGDELDLQLAYWKKQLAELPALNLPTDRPYPPEQTYHGGWFAFELSPELTAALSALSRAHGTTMTTTLLAAFQVLLGRHARQHDVVVGMPVANRSRSELEGLIGLFVSTLVLRADLGGDPPFTECLERSKELCIDAYAHQDIPFEMLVEALRPERDLSRNPLFQVLFAMQMPSGDAASVTELTVEEYRGAGGGAPITRFDLELNLRELPDTVAGAFCYRLDLFDGVTIQRMSQNFVTLLEGIVANPAARLSELPMLTASEREQIVVEWNRTARDYPPDSTLHERFEQQAARTPEAVALAFGDQHLTYAELNARANQLARVLQARGVGPEVPVGVFMERSLELVVSIYGILKAGGAYVPLDPEDPKPRLLHMLSVVRMPVLLTQSRLADQVPDEAGSEIIRLDADWRTIAGEEDSPVRGDTQPDNLAYVIFTSGSTGAPKGAMNTHRAICNRLDWMQETYGLTAVDRVLQKTPYTFDVSVWEFFWPLLVGARLVVAPPGAHRDPGELLRVIGEHGITTVHFVPSMLQAFLDAADLTPVRCLKRVICSGEALTPALHDRFFGAMDAELHNLYGPTEAAIDVTAHACAPVDGQHRVPIGRPVANTQIYLLDEALQPTPLGVPGHLHIGGVQVGRGYLGQPALTADRFIADPFSQQPGARLYATGDLARYRAGGTIDFLGRIDHQVKVRGYRIELGEIESALRQHTAVREAVAMVWDHGPEDRRLVAYVAGETLPRADELRAWARERLPSHMVPSVIVFVDAFALTPSGKVDRKALPSPERGHVMRPAFVAPRTPVEEELAHAWCEFLGVERVGIHDNFFELGGHSLLATRVITRMRRCLGVELSVRMMFNAPTIEGLAEEIVRRLAERESSDELARMIDDVLSLSDEDLDSMLSQKDEPER